MMKSSKLRFPGGGNKNASDMRLAMDATALLNDETGVDFFLLVTGDADFIPLVLELKRRGAEVAVIGVMWHTKPVFQRYCDRFEYFEVIDRIYARMWWEPERATALISEGGR